MQRESADNHYFYFAAVANTHRHLVLHQPPFIPQLLLRVTNVSNRTGIKYPSVTLDTSEVNINNMYIIYTFVFPGNLAGLLIL